MQPQFQYVAVPQHLRPYHLRPYTIRNEVGELGHQAWSQSRLRHRGKKQFKEQVDVRSASGVGRKWQNLEVLFIGRWLPFELETPVGLRIDVEYRPHC